MAPTVRTTRIPIGFIHVGQRRREEVGDMDELAQSIEHYGLLHPIVIDAGYQLVAGARRLQAVQGLGWHEIDCRMLDDLTPAERLEIEFEENVRRKDLTPYERSKNLAALAEAAAVVDRQETRSKFERVSQEPRSRGPGAQPGSLRRVAERTGLSPSQITEARQHVAAVKRHPEVADQPQSTAVDYAAAVEENPALAGQPVEDAVAAYRARRAAIRQERERGQEESGRLMEAGLSPEAREAIEDRNRAATLMRELAAAQNLLALKPDVFGPIAAEERHRVTVERFIADARGWCDAMELAMPPALRVVGSNT